MECFRCMHRDRQPYGYCNEQDPAVLHLCIPPHYGITDPHLYVPRILAQPQEICDCGEEESVVLSVNKLRRLI